MTDLVARLRSGPCFACGQQAADRIEQLEAELARVRANTLAEVERHLSACQYSPAPYTDMKHRLAAIKEAQHGFR